MGEKLVSEMIYSKEDIERLKEVVFIADKEGSLEGVIKRSEGYEFGEIRKSLEGNFYVDVTNTRVFARNRLEIPKEIAENERYRDLFYDAEELARAAEEKKKNEIGQELKEKTWGDLGRYALSRLAAATIIASSIYGINSYFNSPSYLAKKEAQKAVELRESEEQERKNLLMIKEQQRKELFVVAYNYILPPKGENRIYALKDGSRAAVSHEKTEPRGFFGLTRSILNIDLNGKIRFSCIDGFHSASDPPNKLNFDMLNDLSLYDGKKWEEFPWRSQSQWQKRYEDLVIEIYQERNKIENGFGQELDEKLKNSENMKEAK